MNSDFYAILPLILVYEEKQVSFDVEKAKETEIKHLYNFAGKTKKRRTRNVGPTV